ncbi:GDSL-type esterase/lipase family protein [Microbulbifer epialgicus]|uniref:GDSL-type esterase/lipase family protein n=1 Tax=Microbulbifer epialgicus TaxID=393907 RepID=A0ABV4NVC5_9GAMM
MTKRVPRKVVFIGSSSIYGKDDTELGGFVQRFRFRFEALDPKNLVYSLGVFGENVASLAVRLSYELPPRRPHLIGVYPGYNDICRIGGPKARSAVTLDLFRQAMQQLLQASKMIAPTFVMTGIPFDELRTTPLQNSNIYFFRSDAALYAEIIREVAVTETIPILDFDILWRKQELVKFLSEDGLHANAEGHQLLYEQTWDFVSKNFF